MYHVLSFGLGASSGVGEVGNLGGGSSHGQDDPVKPDLRILAKGNVPMMSAEVGVDQDNAQLYAPA